MADTSYISGYTGTQIDEGIAKARKLPDTSAGDSNKLLAVGSDGNVTKKTIAQTTGNSTSDVMSQKAVTDAIGSATNDMVPRNDTQVTTNNVWSAAKVKTEFDSMPQIDDEAVSPSSCWSSEKTNGELNAKPDKEGVYPSLVAGDLAGREGDAVPALFGGIRAAGGSADVGSGIATLKKIKGNSLFFNQIAKQGSPEFTNNGITFSQTNGRVVTSGQAEGTAYRTVKIEDNLIFGGHKYMLCGNTKAGSNSTFEVFVQYKNVDNNFVMVKDNEFGKIIVFPDEWNKTYGVYLGINIYNGRNGGDVFYPQLFDLTRMFGHGNEPTAAEFKKMFPDIYYSYNSGTPLNFTGNGLKTAGFNLFDKSKTVFGEVATEDGFDDTHPNLAHSDYIKAIPNTEYHVENTFGMVFGYAVVYYDANKGVIGGHYEPTEDRFTEVNFTTPALCDSFIVNFYGEAADDVCVNLSHSGYRDGEYEPYWENLLALPVSDYFTDGMKSTWTAYDELTPEKAVKRVGKKAMEDLEYTYHEPDETHPYGYFSSTIVGKAQKVNDIKCSEYPTSASFETDKVIFGKSNEDTVYIVDSDYTDGEALKEALTGETVFYELAEYEETQIDPPLDLSYRVDDFGTEEILAEGQSAPMNADIVYAMNAVDTIRNLPKNYISKASMDNFTSALGETLDKTITATWDETRGEYLFEITEREDE